MAKLHKPNAYDGVKSAGVGKNSLVIESDELVTKAVGVVDKADAGESIVGLSFTKDTMASDNQTVTKERIQYYLLWDKDLIELDVSGITLAFSGDLIIGNTIDLDVNGTAMTQVAFNTNNATTLGDIATQLVTDFPTLIASASADAWNDSVLITPVTTNGSVLITDITVSGGASQATGTVSNNVIDYTKEGKFYDITTGGQSLNYHSEHASSGQVKLEQSIADGTVAVVVVANT